jgi:hypothetical protein
LLDIASKIDDDSAFSEKIKNCAKQINEMDNPIAVSFKLKENPFSAKAGKIKQPIRYVASVMDSCVAQ